MSVTTKSIRHWPQTVVSLLITVVVIAAIIISALAIAALTIVHASPAPAMLQISVVEKGSRKPLNHATVILDDNDIYAITNDKGFAKLPVIQYPANLTITAFGYESKHIVVDRAVPTFVVYLPLSPDSRDKIVISAQRLPQQTSKISVSAAQINSTAGGQSDPVKILDALPGVVTANEGTGVFFMRGSGSRDSVVWINQMPVGFLYHWGGLQSTINPDLVADMNVFLGGFPVEYGDHMGGAIDVKLRPPQQDRTRYNVHLSNYVSSLSIEGPAHLVSNESSYYLGARRSYIDALLSPQGFTDFAESNTNEEERNRWVDVPEFYDVQAMFQQPLPKGGLEFSYFTAQDSLAVENNQAANTDPELAGLARYKYGYESLGTLWRHRWSKSLYHTMPLAYFRLYENSQFGSDPQGNPYHSEGELRTVYFRPEFAWHWDTENQFYFGLESDVSNGNVDLRMPLPQDESAPPRDFTSSAKYSVQDSLEFKQYSPYVKHHSHWGHGFFTDLGLRYSAITSPGNIHMSGVSPRFSIEYKLSNRLLLLASWGKFLQRPELFELTPGFGNPGLDFTEAEHRIVGFKYKMDRTWGFDVEMYHKPMKNLTVRVADKPPPDNIVNKGKGQAYGLDLYIKRQISRRNLTWLSYSYLKSERTDTLTGETYPFTGDQPHTLNLVWSRPLSKTWDWSAKIQAHSGRPFTAVVGREQEDPQNPDSRWLPVYGATNGERLPTYYKFNLRFEQHKVFNQWQMLVYYDVQLSNNVIGYDYGSEYQDYGKPEETKTESFLFFFGLKAKY